MLRIVFALLILTALPDIALADLGGAVVYHATINLKSGDSQEGYFIVVGYEEYTGLDRNGRNRFCNDTGLMSVFRMIASKNRVMGYREIYYPKYFRLPGEDHKPDVRSQLSAVLSSDTFSVHYSEIRSVRFHDAEVWRSYFPGVECLRIVGPDMLDMFRYGPFWGGYVMPPIKNSEIGIILLNFNDKYNQAEIERLFKTHWEKKLNGYDQSEEKYFDATGRKDQDRAKKDFNEYQKAREEMQVWFEERNVIVVFDWGTC